MLLKAQNEFITVWKPSNTGLLPTTSTSNQILFPGVGTGYKIYWEEVGYPTHNGILDNVTTLLNNPLLIDFGSSLNPVPANATYILKVSNGNGNFHRICFYSPSAPVRGDIYKIIEVSQWGNIKWSSMANAFFYCEEMDVTATDIPFLNHLTDMSGMFGGCYKLAGNSSFSNWDLSAVTNLSQFFYSAKIFNQPISSWNISNVTDISLMFFGATSFNQPIGNWDTSQVINMQGALAFTGQFNQPLANWDTSNVTNMSLLFSDALLFNQPIGNWDTSQVTNMSHMFGSTQMFNQPIANWNTSNVTNIKYMFTNAAKFNQPIGNWDTSKVTDMSGVFRETKAFDQPIGNWNTSKVTNMMDMFARAEKFNQPIGNWNTSLVTNMSYMFTQTLLFNQPIGSWNTSNVDNMLYMFTDNPIFNQPIGNWNTSSVTDMRHAFKNATAFNHDLSNWSLYSVTQLNSMLDFSGLSCANYNTTLQGWANSTSTPSNLALGSSGLVYSTPQALAARNTLTNLKGWTITNDTYDIECNVLSTSEANKKPGLNIYPNPVKSTLFFSEELKEIEIYSIQGKLLKRSPKGNNIDISELLKGIYILKAKDNSENSLSKKFIKD
ncbi:BspA family leucine-rich repeat surface protein [Chryseobacterium lathyri]|uniref:BspA family leucine-rich repeat surface protein n=1 Tax=Chryseobacterium lathyri TaxID=395933 RepID=UPI00277FAD9E|nr:BspA family leucine-rich repeat surface protein [Chryseobacterium lathyri]MDQ0067921.1 surface protein [Chryseobacterium lathyri]